MRNIRKFKTKIALFTAALLIALAPQTLPARTETRLENTATNQTTQAQLSKQVRHKLLMLPYYGVFDNLAYSIDGTRVTLHGQVVRPSTRSDAERSVAKIQGVTEVVNNIQVLPLSSFDDSVRVDTLRAISRTGGLHRYFMGANPSLHIIVDRGHVTLAGVVGSRLDRQLAYTAARGVFGAMSVTNELKVDGENIAR